MKQFLTRGSFDPLTIHARGQHANPLAEIHSTAEL